MLNAFRCKQFALTLISLKEFQRQCHIAHDTGQAGSKAPDDLLKRVIDELDKAVKLCEDSCFDSARHHVDLSKARLEFPKVGAVLMAALMAELQNCEDSIMSDMWRCKFLLIEKNRSKEIDAEALFGDEVKTKFPSAAPDIREAGNCLSIGCSTAAVFHLMRAVEWGLRALGVTLGFRRLKAKNHKTGQVTYTPIAYEDWDRILNQLQSRVEKRLARLRRGPKKQLYQEFYYPAVLDIRAMKDSWRNHVMHTRREYTQPEADAIRGRVEQLLRLLATRLSEV